MRRMRGTCSTCGQHAVAHHDGEPHRAHLKSARHQRALFQAQPRSAAPPGRAPTRTLPRTLEADGATLAPFVAVLAVAAVLTLPLRATAGPTVSAKLDLRTSIKRRPVLDDLHFEPAIFGHAGAGGYSAQRIGGVQ